MKKGIIIAVVVIVVIWFLMYLKESAKERGGVSFVHPLDTLSYIHTGSGYTTRLLLTPASEAGTEILWIPSDTRLKVIDRRAVQMGQIRGYWFYVEYKGHMGWISQFSTKEGE
jgi:hypothetical protein